MPLNGCTHSADDSATDVGEHMPERLDVVCFGALCSLRIGTIDEYPTADGGAEILSLVQLIAADAPIVSLTLKGLGCRVGLVSNDVGDEPDGRELLDRLRKNGIVTTATLLSDVSTPFGLTVVDRDGHSTWFVFLSNSVASLMAADLSLVRRAGLLYVDVYGQTWQAGIRAIDCAQAHGVPIVVNLSDHAPTEELDRQLQQGMSILQRSAAGQSTEQAREVCQTSFDRYCASLSVITMGPRGVIYTNRSGTYHLPAYPVQVANTAGGGATFSAGLIFGRVQSWPDDEAVAFANALAGLYCSVPNGLGRFSATEVEEFEANGGLRSTKLG